MCASVCLSVCVHAHVCAFSTSTPTWPHMKWSPTMCWELFWTLEINQLLPMSESCLPFMPLHSPFCALIWNVSTSYTRQAASRGHAFTQCCSCCLGLLSPPTWLTFFCLSDLAGWYCLQEVVPVTPPSLAGLGVSLRDFIMFRAYVYCEIYSNSKPTLKECILCSRSCTQKLTCINVFNLHNMPMKWDSF